MTNLEDHTRTLIRGLDSGAELDLVTSWRSASSIEVPDRVRALARLPKTLSAIEVERPTAEEALRRLVVIVANGSTCNECGRQASTGTNLRIDRCYWTYSETDGWRGSCGSEALTFHAAT